MFYVHTKKDCASEECSYFCTPSPAQAAHLLDCRFWKVTKTSGYSPSETNIRNLWWRGFHMLFKNPGKHLNINILILLEAEKHCLRLFTQIITFPSGQILAKINACPYIFDVNKGCCKSILCYSSLSRMLLAPSVKLKYISKQFGDFCSVGLAWKGSF